MLNLGDLMELETQTRYTLSQNIYTLEQQLAGLNLGDLMEPLEPQTRYILSQNIYTMEQQLAGLDLVSFTKYPVLA